MELKWMAVGAFALIPCAAMAQSKTARDSSSMKRDTAQQSTARQSTSQTTSATSTGEVSTDPNVTQAMIAAQNDPNLIGSPAWWKNHGTADGKPPINRSNTSH